MPTSVACNYAPVSLPLPCSDGVVPVAVVGTERRMRIFGEPCLTPAISIDTHVEPWCSNLVLTFTSGKSTFIRVLVLVQSPPLYITGHKVYFGMVILRPTPSSFSSPGRSLPLSLAPRPRNSFHSFFLSRLRPATIGFKCGPMYNEWSL